MQFQTPPSPREATAADRLVALTRLGYFRRALFPIQTPSEVQMTRLKSRLYSPVLVAAVTALAASGGAFRIT